jgi:hypothetical protein
LLSLSGTTESEITYFMKEPPAKAIVEQKKRPQQVSGSLKYVTLDIKIDAWFIMSDLIKTKETGLVL